MNRQKGAYFTFSGLGAVVIAGSKPHFPLTQCAYT